jgi:hypothetical protein
LGSNSLAHLDEITIVVRVVVVCKQRQTFFRAFGSTAGWIYSAIYGDVQP